MAAGRDLGPREDSRADEGGSRRFPGCGGVIRTESKRTGPRGHGRQQGRGGARVDGAIPQRWKGANRGRGWGWPVGLGGHRAASSGTPVSRVQLLPPDPGLEGLPLEDEHRRGPAQGCWGAYADAQAPWRPRGVKGPRLPDPRGVNGVLDEASKAPRVRPRPLPD